MYVFSNNHLVLDNKLVCPFLWKTISPTQHFLVASASLMNKTPFAKEFKSWTSLIYKASAQLKKYSNWLRDLCQLRNWQRINIQNIQHSLDISKPLFSSFDSFLFMSQAYFSNRLFEAGEVGWELFCLFSTLFFFLFLVLGIFRRSFPTTLSCRCCLCFLLALSVFQVLYLCFWSIWNYFLCKVIGTGFGPHPHPKTLFGLLVRPRPQSQGTILWVCGGSQLDKRFLSPLVYNSLHIHRGAMIICC